MNWEAILSRFPEGDIKDVPRAWQAPVLGTLTEVKSLLEEAFPQGNHVEGISMVACDDAHVVFRYDPLDEEDETVRAIQVESPASVHAIPLLQTAGEKLDCRLLDLQTTEFADFGEQTEESMSKFVKYQSRMNQEWLWSLFVTAAAMVVFHSLQDSGVLPAVERLSKSATGVYGFLGLILLNAVAFLSSMLLAMSQADRVKDEVPLPEERERLEGSILEAAMRGEGNMPRFLARYLHIAFGVMYGIIAGSIVAWTLSLKLF